MRNRTTVTVSLLAGAVALIATACGSAGSNPAAPAASKTHHPMAEHSHPRSHSHSMSHALTARFGMDCGMVPATGMGSFHSMGMDPVVTAAAHNPLLTRFAAEVKKAGLVGELNSARGITIFAPDNDAFAKLHGSAMSMLDDPANLAETLKFFVVKSHVTPDQFGSVKKFTTMAGDTLKLAKMGSVYEVNTADVVCGNIATANATVYVINTVLEPMHMH
jgi:uncharacterized surface protein with fasciclin (FAS1) repeats